MEGIFHKFKWFWAWQDEKEESWLRTMSQQGWHLVSARPFGVYYFRGGDKSDFVYRLDFQIKKKTETTIYRYSTMQAGNMLVRCPAGNISVNK